MQGESREGCSEPHERSHTHLFICHMKTRHCLNVANGMEVWKVWEMNDFALCGVANYGNQSLSCLVVLWSLNLIPSHNISMMAYAWSRGMPLLTLHYEDLKSCLAISLSLSSLALEKSHCHTLCQYIENMASWHLQPKRCESTWKYIFSPCHIFDAINYSLNTPSGGAQIQIRAGNTGRLMATGNERDDTVSVSRCEVVRWLDMKGLITCTCKQMHCR